MVDLCSNYLVIVCAQLYVSVFVCLLLVCLSVLVLLYNCFLSTHTHAYTFELNRFTNSMSSNLIMLPCSKAVTSLLCV